MNGQKQRFDNLDLLKLFAILSVIIIHGGCLSFYFWLDRDIVKYLHYGFKTILSASVPVFFLCNGFLLFGKELDLKKHVTKTLKYIVITYIWAVLTVFVLMPIRGEYMSIRGVLLAVREWRMGWVNHLWFMGTLVCIYVIFPLLKWVAEYKKNALFYLVITVSVFTFGNNLLGMLTSIILKSDVSPRFFDIFNPFEGAYDWAYVYFGIGGLLYLYKDKIIELFVQKRKLWNITCILVLLVSCVGLFSFGVFITDYIIETWDVVWNGYDTIFTLMSTLALYGLSLNYRVKKQNVFTNFVKIVSQNTLGIYFVHMVFVHLTLDYVQQIPMFNNILMQITYAFAILLASLVVVLLMRKIPILNQLVK